jgi:hypothetical protein
MLQTNHGSKENNMPILNHQNISAFLRTRTDDSLNAIVQQIIHATKRAANCESLISNPKYPAMLEAAQKRGTLTPSHQILLEQMEQLRKLECHKNSLRNKAPKRI